MSALRLLLYVFGSHARQLYLMAISWNASRFCVLIFSLLFFDRDTQIIELGHAQGRADKHTHFFKHVSTASSINTKHGCVQKPAIGE